MRLLVILVAIIYLECYQCARILGVFPMPAKSHYILGSALMRGLAEKGHDVTVVSPFGETDYPKNGTYRDIILTGFVQKLQERKSNLFDLESMNPLLYLIMMNIAGNDLTESTFNHSNVRKLLKSNEKFDIVIVEQFINDAHKVFAHHYNAHLILFSTFGSNAWINPLIGNPAPPSYVPELMISFSFNNFWDRLKNAFINVCGELNRHLIFFPQQNRIMKNYFPDAPDLGVINYNISLVLLNSHVSTNQPVPRVPNMIDIGGFHVQPAKKLSQSLQQFLDSAKDGVIYFSMGSALKSANLPESKRKSLLKSFSRVKPKILWKWEDSALPDRPSNVKLGSWLPQQDILAHPNVKLFITHGGLLSLIESVYHAVPVLAIPIFGDQKINAAAIDKFEIGLSLPYADLNETILTEYIGELLNNPQYKENIERRSRIMHDRPVKPMDMVDYWIRYIIRHGGGEHLRVAGLDLPWFQYSSLDSYIVIAIITATIVWCFALLVKKLICKSFHQKSERKIKIN